MTEQAARAHSTIETADTLDTPPDGRTSPRQTCFICARLHSTCDVPQLDGTLLQVLAPIPRQHTGRALLRLADGTEAVLILPERTKTLTAALAKLSPEDLARLPLRAYHLERAGTRPSGAPGTAPRPVYRATAASAFVLAPDLLLNITDLNQAEYCARQHLLRRMVPSPPTEATLRGTIVHAAFKEMLKQAHPIQAEHNDRAPEESSRQSSQPTLAPEHGDILPHLRQAVRAVHMDLALRQVSPDQMLTEAEPHLRALATWHTSESSSLWGSISQLRAETFLLAPAVGLKGRLDFSAREGTSERLLELKTGNAYGELPKRPHRAQVQGYQTLLAARHPDARTQPGATLLYSGTPGRAEAHGIPYQPHDLPRVLDARNLLALIAITGQVPAPPGERKCARCAIRLDCHRASRLLDWEAPKLPEEEIEPDLLTPEDAREFKRFTEMLLAESRATHAQTALLWQLSAEERCRAGIALGNLTLVGEPRLTASGEWEYTFSCAQTSEFREGDAILLSDGDPLHGAVVSGSILRIDDHSVTVWTPEPLPGTPMLIDRYESDTVSERTSRNLWRWLAVDEHLRRVVRGEVLPRFDAQTEAEALATLPATLNEPQRLAVARSLAAQDYLLIQGPPGTGKTAVVAELATRAIARGERVLLGAFTNQAVDNALRRIVALGERNVVRLGHDLSVAADMRPYRAATQAHRISSGHPLSSQGEGAGGGATTLTANSFAGAPTAATDLNIEEDPSPAALRALLRHAPLVAATTATWSAERFDGTGDVMRFDLAIIDEASQLTIPALLGALRFARRFVLVGDDQQLPPLVMSAEALAMGLGRSLFLELQGCCGRQGEVRLRQQYRMHPTICDFSSREFYDGALVAEGEARTALLPLDLTHLADQPEYASLVTLLDPARPLAFVDVPDDSSGIKRSQAQADLAARLALALRQGGIPAAEIGVIAPYRAQVAAVRQALVARGESAISVDTVDRFQGAERTAILFTFGGVVDPVPGARGLDFLADPHRLNVALTRAKRKLLLLGNRAALETTPLLRRLIEYCASV